MLVLVDMLLVIKVAAEMKHKADSVPFNSIRNMMSFEPEGCEDGWMSVVGLMVCWIWRPYTVVFMSQSIKLRLIASV